MKKDINKWIEKKFKVIPDKLKEKLIEAIEKGAYYTCEEPDCLHEWRADPGKIYERCPVCGSHRITIGTKKKGKFEALAFLFEDWS